MAFRGKPVTKYTRHTENFTYRFVEEDDLVYIQELSPGDSNEIAVPIDVLKEYVEKWSS